jgi:hypothetical protein
MGTHRYLTSAFVLAAMASPAAAQQVAGSYEVKFEEMSTNCSPPPVSYGRTTLKIDVAKNSLRVNIDALRRELVGIPQKSGKINAKTTRPLASTVQGLDVKYGISGRVDDNGVVQLVLVAEYIRQDTKKPHCSQSWNITGIKQTPETDDAPKPKSALDFLVFPAVD